MTDSLRALQLVGLACLAGIAAAGPVLASPSAVPNEQAPEEILLGVIITILGAFLTRMLAIIYRLKGWSYV